MGSMIINLDHSTKRELGFAVWKTLFDEQPAAENLFKQSNEKLCQIALKGMEFVGRIFDEPKAVVNEVTSLGLRHIMWQVDAKWFIPYVEVYTRTVSEYCDGEVAVEGFSWALSIIACIMSRTIVDGNTPILQAAVTNNVKAMKKALGDRPRGTRNLDCLATQGY